jgi:hypothetical protein
MVERSPRHTNLWNDPSHNNIIYMSIYSRILNIDYNISMTYKLILGFYDRLN